MAAVKTAAPPRPPAGRDQQRSAVYTWEQGLASRMPRLRRRLSLAQCEAYVARVWHDLRPGVAPPAVKDGRGRRSGLGTPTEIKLPKFARRPYYVLHEVAHAVNPGGEGHGPAFARVLLDLLVRYEGVERLPAMLAAVHQRPRRVRFAAVDPLRVLARPAPTGSLP